MKKRSYEERYMEQISRQKQELEKFVAGETEYAGLLMRLYRQKKKDMPDGEYRAAAFFQNRGFESKPGAVVLLYQMYLRCMDELPKPTRELAFDLLAYRFRMYAAALEKGGFGM